MATRFLRPARVVALALLVGLAAIAATVAIGWTTGEPSGVVTRDVRAVAFDEGVDLPAFAGAVSLLTIMVWAAAAALTLCAAALGADRRRWNLGLGGLLVLLAVDDAYMLHESTGVTVIEFAFYLAYASVTAWLLAHSVRRHHDATTVAFVIGAAFLGVSSLVDLLSHGHYLVEDGTKLIGALVLVALSVLSLARLVDIPGHDIRLPAPTGATERSAERSLAGGRSTADHRSRVVGRAVSRERARPRAAVHQPRPRSGFR